MVGDRIGQLIRNPLMVVPDRMQYPAETKVQYRWHGRKNQRFYCHIGPVGAILRCYYCIRQEGMLCMDEWFSLADETGAEKGSATRRECHGGSFLLHRVVHLLVFRTDGALLLQKRALTKDIQPGKWDTSVGGHVQAGESLDDALVREAAEELGIADMRAERLYTYIMESPVEREYVTTFRCVWDGPVSHQQDEIDEVRWFASDSLDELLSGDTVTPNFREEWEYYRRWCAVRGECGMFSEKES